MADTGDLKSLAQYRACGFESRSWHQPSLLRSYGWQAERERTCNDWRGVRVVDGATLERLCGRKSTGGSNPPPSASVKCLILAAGMVFSACRGCGECVGTFN